MEEERHPQALTKGLIMELERTYSSERTLLSALPDLINSAETPELRKALMGYLRQTQLQIARLERAGKILGVLLEPKPCPAMKGLVDELESLLEGNGEMLVHDLLLAAATERLVHYQIASYPTLLSIGEYIAQDELTDLLQRNLEEEISADELFADLMEELLSLSSPGDEEDDDDDEDDDEEDADEEDSEDDFDDDDSDEDLEDLDVEETDEEDAKLTSADRRDFRRRLM